jgi:transposase-like protein
VGYKNEVKNTTIDDYMKIPEKKRYAGKYDPALKIAIAREYLTTDQGYDTLAKKYNIAEGTLPSFIRWYQQRYPDGITDQQQDATPIISRDKDLQQAHLKIEALELLIEHAGKELGVDLVKKFGTKQYKP